MVGGYKVLDLKKTNITVHAVKVPGIFDKIEASVGKPILLRNIVVDGRERHSVYCFPTAYGSGYMLMYSISNTGVINFLHVESGDDVNAHSFNPSSQSGDEPFSGEDGPSASM